MKKKYLLSTILLFSYLFAFSQNQLTGVEFWYLNNQDVLTISNKSLFHYDEFGNEVLTNNLIWKLDSISFIPSFRITKTYNENNLITNFKHERYRDNMYGYYINKKIDYTYEGECLQSISEFNSPIYSTPRKFTFYNPTTCLIDSIEVHYFSNLNTAFEKDYVDRYFYSGNIETRIRFCKDSLDNFNVECSKSIYTKDDRGLIIRIEGDSDIGPELYIKEYDEKRNLVYESYSGEISPGIWDLFQEKNITYTFNQAEQLQEKQTITIGYLNGITTGFSTATENYEYNCEDLLKTKTSISASGRTSVEYYQYLNDHNCNLSEDIDLLTIRPNFTQGYVLIESEILQNEKSYIHIYNMSGSLMKQFKPVSVNNYQLDLSTFPNGNYIIHVFNKNHSEIERVLKM